MKCNHADCTGKHSNSTPIKERCPAAVERKNRWSRERYYSNDPRTRHQIRKWRFHSEINQRRRRIARRRAEMSEESRAACERVAKALDESIGPKIDAILKRARVGSN